MNIVFASISSHSSTAFPSVGLESDIKRAGKMIKGMKVLAQELNTSKLYLIIVISPHMPVNFTSFSIIESSELKGSLDKFGDFKTEMKFDNHPAMISAIKKICAKERILLKSFNDPKMDYGTTIPLYFFSQENPKIKVVSVGVSGLSPMEHFNFGRAIAKAVKYCKVKVAIVASGELSHRLNPSSSEGYSLKGKVFDQVIMNLLKKGNNSAILDIDPELLDESKECGYLPMTILFGALDGISWKGDILFYENSFGIGYLVANLKISKKK